MITALSILLILALVAIVSLLSMLGTEKIENRLLIVELSKVKEEKKLLNMALRHATWSYGKDGGLK